MYDAYPAYRVNPGLSGTFASAEGHGGANSSGYLHNTGSMSGSALGSKTGLSSDNYGGRLWPVSDGMFHDVGIGWPPRFHQI